MNFMQDGLQKKGAKILSLKDFLKVVSSDTIINLYINGDYVGRISVRELILGRAINYFLLGSDVLNLKVENVFLKNINGIKTPVMCVEL